MNLYKTDKIRRGELPPYQYWMRKLQSNRGGYFIALYKILYRITSLMYCNDISDPIPQKMLTQGSQISVIFGLAGEGA